MTPSATVLVPEVRDYHRINLEVLRMLQEGATHIRLAGVAGQRLLLAGLQGLWNAQIEIDGTAGPDLAFGMDAPGLTVVVLGSAATGAAANLRSGRVLILRDAGEALGAGQSGGLVITCETAGHRAGLGQAGGTLILLGKVGRLVGDRRTGGSLVLDSTQALAPFGRGATEASWLEPREFMESQGFECSDQAALRQAIEAIDFTVSEDHSLSRLLQATSRSQS